MSERYLKEDIEQLKNLIFLIEKELEKVFKQLQILSARIEYLNKRIDKY